MYRVLVVDDELFIRKRIILGFPWEELGYRVTGEAKSGAEALSMLEARHFDVAIVDIAMPGMSGIELVKEIRRREIPLAIIFLTGHSNFEYAKEALTEGVFYYSLKPLNEEEFTSALHRLARQLEAEQRRRQNMQQLLSIQRKAEQADAGWQMSKLFHAQRLSGEEVAAHLKDLGMDDSADYVAVVFCRDEYLHNVDDIDQWTQPVEAALGEWRGRFLVSTAFYDLFENHVAVLIGVSPKVTNKECMRLMNVFCQDLRKRQGRELTAGISNRFQGLELLQEAFRQARSALRNSMVLGKPVVFFAELAPLQGRRAALNSAQEKQLRVDIENGQTDHCRKLIMEIFQEAKAQQVLYENLYFFSSRLLSVIAQEIARYQKDVQPFLGGYRGLDSAFARFHSVEEIGTWFARITDRVIESIQARRKKGNNLKIAQKTQTYILQRFQQQDLSVVALAEELSVTPTYLSTSFKKAMGMSATQYITMLRLEKARELLEAGAVNVRSVAMETGYSDEFYFSRCFKKYFGVSPSTLKNNLVWGAS